MIGKTTNLTNHIYNNKILFNLGEKNLKFGHVFTTVMRISLSHKTLIKTLDIARQKAETKIRKLNKSIIFLDVRPFRIAFYFLLRFLLK